MSYFTDLGLAEPILRALGTKGYSEPTPIQRQAIPALLEGRDLLGIAQTGTGKTAAFSLPSIQRLVNDPQPLRPASCRMLVLSPTRELAAQIAENVRGYSRHFRLSVQCVFGGVPVTKNARALVPGCDILVATPGRLLDLIEQRALTLRNVEIFVLDEADQMMDLGFIVPLKRIASLLPPKRQSLFFSATMPKAIAELGKQFIHDPVRVEVTPQATTAERVEQYATFLNQAEKQALLTLRLRDGLADGSVERALVFTRTKHGADRVVRHLVTAGIGAAAIHGNKSQPQRTMAIQGFRSGKLPVLVATDIAARGIDIPGVSHVFNFEMPNVPEQYVHRIGRTARAGADGIAMSFVAPDEKAYLRDIERLTRVQLMPMSLPEDFTKQAARLPAPSKKVLAEAGGRPARREHGRDDRARGDRPAHGRPRHERSRDDRPRSDKPRQDRPHRERPRSERPQAEERRQEWTPHEGQRHEGHRHDGRSFGEHRRDGRPARNDGGEGRTDNRPFQPKRFGKGKYSPKPTSGQHPTGAQRPARAGAAAGNGKPSWKGGRGK